MRRALLRIGCWLTAILLGAWMAIPSTQAATQIGSAQIKNGAIQSQHLAAGLATNPAGAVQAFAGSSAPSGWVLCDGATYDGTQQAYTALWGVIGTTYGGTGQSAFKVPDARGRAVVGAGQGTGLTNRVMATIGGAETHTLTVAEMPSHTHVDNTFYMSAVPGLAAGSNWIVAGGSVNTGATGGGGAHNNMQPWLALNAIIKL